MANTYTYDPTNLVSDSNGVVRTVDFIVTVSDGTDSYTVNGTTGLQESGAFIPYNNLTKETVIGWIKNVVGAQMEELADSELAAFKVRKANPITNGTPW